MYAAIKNRSLSKYIAAPFKNMEMETAFFTPRQENAMAITKNN